MNRLKDREPYETITFIRNILASFGFFITEAWSDSGVSSLYSVRLEIAGTRVGTNGKGATKLLALASAYGEFMERLSNGALFMHLEKDLSRHYGDRLYVPLLELAKGGRIIDTVLEAMEGKKSCQFTLERRLSLFRLWNMEKDRDILCFPYKGLYSKVEEILPVSFIRHYGSHGMAAGNTVKEAVVQAVSEIVERYCLAKIYEKGLTPPVIERTLIFERFPSIRRIIEEIEKGGHFYIEVRDCSLGRGFPAYCVCLCDKNAHRAAVSFGSSPSIGASLERSFTELLQGRHLGHSATSIPGGSTLPPPFEIRRLFRSSTGNYPLSFWSGTPSWQADRGLLEISFTDNSHALDYLSEFFLKQGSEIFVRDVSGFGFPSVHVIIPGFSEVMGCSPFFLRYLSTRKKIGKLFDRLADCSKEELELVVEFTDFCRKMSSCDSTPFSRIEAWPNLGPVENICLFLASGNAVLEKMSAASEFCRKAKSQLNGEEADAVSCLADCYDMLSRTSHQDPFAVLEHFYSKSSVALARRIKEMEPKDFIKKIESRPLHGIDFEKMFRMAENYTHDMSKELF